METVALIEAGERETANQVFTEAQAWASAIENYEFQAEALNTLATAMAERGDFQRAQATVSAIGDAGNLAEALSALTVALIEAGERETANQVFTEAQAVATDISDGWLGDYNVRTFEANAKKTLEELTAMIANQEESTEIKAGQVLGALFVLGERDLNKFVETLAKWKSHFDQVDPAAPDGTPLSMAVLRAALQICAWESPGWQKVYMMLNESGTESPSDEKNT